MGSGSRKAKIAHKKESEEISCFEELNVHFEGGGDGGFFCRLKALHRVLKNIIFFIKNFKFLQLLKIQFFEFFH
jgi:hypothetical protein